jgi:hypothetical protein
MALGGVRLAVGQNHDDLAGTHVSRVTRLRAPVLQHLA